MIGIYRRPWLTFSHRRLYERRRIFFCFFSLRWRFDSLLCRITACVPTDSCAGFHPDAASPLMWFCRRQVAAFPLSGKWLLLLPFAVIHAVVGVVLALLVFFAVISVVHCRKSDYSDHKRTKIRKAFFSAYFARTPPPPSAVPPPKVFKSGF